MREAVVPLGNYPIMADTLIWLIRHLKHQNPYSNGSENFSVPFLTTRKAVESLANDPIVSGTLIWSFRHVGH